MLISALNIYPLKSARGIPLSQSPITWEGLPGDRRPKFVHASGQLLTQRELPAISRITALPSDSGLRLSTAPAG